MKKIKHLVAVCALFSLFFGQAHAQLLPPMQPETPIVSPIADFTRAQKTFAYSFEEVSFYGMSQNLYLTAWSGPFSGFHWRRATTTSLSPFTETTTEEGVVMLATPGLPTPYDFTSVLDLNTVFITDNVGDVYIIATFYGTKVSGEQGHFVQVYKWAPGSVSLVSTTALSMSPDYGRISLDAHKLYAAVAVWEEGSRLFMKGVLSNSGFMVGPTIMVPAARHRGYIPDVAFTHPMVSTAADDLNARVVYVARGSFYPTVFSVNFYDLMGGTPTYTIDDINPDPFPSSVVGNSIIGDDLKIDCPDHSPSDDWAYIYTTDRSNVKVRGRQSLSPVSTLLLNASSPDMRGFLNQQVAIHYNGSGRIYTGWRSNYSSFAPGQRYVGKVFSISTGVPPAYSVISDGPYAHSSIAFSKQDDIARCLFASYVYYGLPTSTYPSGYNVMNKLKPFSTGIIFSDVKTIDNISVSLSPNPFTETVQIDYQGDPARLFSVMVTNSLGQSVWIAEGDMSELQRSLNAKAGSWPAGYYIFRFQETAGDYSKTIKVVKH